MKYLIATVLIGMMLGTGCTRKYKGGEEPKVGDVVKIDVEGGRVGTVVSTSEDRTSITVRHGETVENMEMKDYSTGCATLIPSSMLETAAMKSMKEAQIKEIEVAKEKWGLKEGIKESKATEVALRTEIKELKAEIKSLKKTIENRFMQRMHESQEYIPVRKSQRL